MFAVPTVSARVSTPTVPPAGCCAHTRGELARRFPSPRSCALTPTFLQVLATELPRPHPTPAPPSPATACRATLSLAQLSRSTLSLNSLAQLSRLTRTHACSSPHPHISDRHGPLDRREARGGGAGSALAPASLITTTLWWGRLSDALDLLSGAMMLVGVVV